MRELDKISESLFNKIRARFDSINLGDENAKRITSPENARFFNFDYISEDGENFGNVTISLIDENTLKIYFSSNITDDLDDEQESEWYDFLRNLKKFARRNMLTFDAKDISRSNLDLKDLKQQTDSDSTYDKEDLAISESKLYGTSRSSYADVGPHKIIIRHHDHIDPERHGSRGRKIKHLFVETPLGERFLLNHTNLHGARAVANHLTHGGTITDEGSQLVNEMVKEMASMRHFVRAMRNRTFEDTETTGMVEAAIHRYNEVRDHLKRFKGRKGHELLLGMIGNHHSSEEEFDENELRERFVKKIYDDRFNEALPYVYRAYKNRKHLETEGSKEFESWANGITEETWDEEGSENSDFLDLMSSPLNVGFDGNDAKSLLADFDFLNKESLDSILTKLAHSQGPDADARSIIAGWLSKHGEKELANQIVSIMQKQNANTFAQPISPEAQKQNYGNSGTDAPVVNESLFDVNQIKKLAGLKF